ncbi:toprim domain-containing protein [Bradyrhizobium sp. MOS002]|uniref:DUF7146 domain-containing protein n=1 Tax=Bradyrhizobium sp. MOS002 TaxID=2133947 RepID=UPI000D13C528|nr:toprim domain-containing protein [Bradyrhizobium sp. MOS002]PSO25196.1 virulence-associated protein E [Bradyrhizobium sp. MOS002]
MLYDPRAVAAALGGDAHGSNISAPGPGHSPSDRSLSVRLDPDAPDGFLVNSFAHDPLKLCRDHVRAALGLRGNQSRTIRPAGEIARVHRTTDEPQRVADALRLWSRTRDPRGTIVEKYLGHRPLPLPDELAGRVVRFHPSLWLDGHHTPAMVTLLRDVSTDEPCGVQRTFVNATSAEKIDRRMKGRAKGAAIKLDPHPLAGRRLVIGEGFETCLAAYVAGLRPVWSVGSAGGIGAFPVLSEINVLIILGENDKNGRNAEVTQACAARWRRAGRQVFVIAPLRGKDFADVWREVAR